MRFIDSTHSYLNDQDEHYTSVTTLIKKYEPHKDWDEIATKYAKKVKKTVEEVKAEWAKAGHDAVTRGTAFHNKMEDQYIKAGIWKIEDVDCAVHSSPIIEGIKKARPLKLDQGIYPELLVYSHNYKVAGQADLVEVVKNTIHIKDYKTSKEIKKESHKHWKNGHEMMCYPLNNFMNSNFWHYSIQLNLYMYMLKAHNPNLKIGTMTILHIIPHKDMIVGDLWDGDPKKANYEDWDEIVEYKVPDLQKDVKRLLEHFKFH